MMTLRAFALLALIAVATAKPERSIPKKIGEYIGSAVQFLSAPLETLQDHDSQKAAIKAAAKATVKGIGNAAISHGVTYGEKGKSVNLIQMTQEMNHWVDKTIDSEDFDERLEMGLQQATPEDVSQTLGVFSNMAQKTTNEIANQAPQKRKLRAGAL